MKDYRKEELKAYVIANIILMIWLSGILNEILNLFNDYSNSFIETIVTPALLSSMICIYIFIIDSIIPANWKEAIIFLIKKRPGETIFTKMKDKSFYDARFTRESAISKYQAIYDEIDKETDKKKKRNIENSKWYQIYLKYQENGSVSGSQRDFLLTRDLCITSIILLLGFIFVCLMYKSITNKPIIYIIIIAEIVFTWIATQVKAYRFVTNVIARDIYNK